LVLPERRLFAAREESASASVVVKLENAHNFGRKEVAAVVHLVSAAVPTLSKDRVSVVSTEGVTLHRPTSDSQGGGDLADLSAEQARVMAQQLESDAQAQLERVLGPGNADVRVNLWLENSAREKTEELYEPTKTALRSEHKVEEGVANGDAGVAGVPGAKTNLPDAQGEGPVAEEKPAGGGGGAVRSQTRNWEVQKVVQKTVTPSGDIRRLSVAVLLNGRTVKKGEKAAFVPIPPDEVKALEETVKRAVGFNAERGDTVNVQATQFAKLDLDDVNAPVSFFSNKPWLPYAAAALALVAVLGTLVLVFRTKKPLPAATPAPALVDPVRVLGELGASGAEMAAAAAALPEAERQRLLEEPQIAGEIRAHALDLAAKDPATAAVVLKAWLSEEAPALPTSSAA
jgi:flagellar M-ring protein FliF